MSVAAGCSTRVLATLLVLSLTAPAIAEPPREATASSLAEPTDPAAVLQQRLTGLMLRCRRCLWGVIVKEADSGRVLLDRNAQLPFNPASNIKLITTAAALAQLGPEHRFVTRLLGNVVGARVKGLTLQGSGDPSLTSAALGALAADLHELGVEEVEGPLYLDTAAFGEKTSDPPGFKAFKSSHPFRAGVDALSLNGNVLRITVSPGEAPGQPGLVSVAAESDYLDLRAQVVTSHRTRLRVATFSAGARTGVHVSGRIAVESEPKQYWRRVYHPALYAGHTMLRQLAAQGIRVSLAPGMPGPQLRRRAAPPETPVLAEHTSEELSAIIRRGNKVSSNVMSEHLLLALGADVFGAPATFDKGRRAVALYLKKVGVKPGTFFLENGSGLSRRSRIRPADLLAVLERTAADLSVGPDLLASLPLAGLDGTLLRRFEGSQATGFVRAKTGTLSGISALSGFAGFKDRRLLFSFLTGRAGKLRPVRRLHVSMAEGLVDYLRQVTALGSPVLAR